MQGSIFCMLPQEMAGPVSSSEVLCSCEPVCSPMALAETMHLHAVLLFLGTHRVQLYLAGLQFLEISDIEYRMLPDGVIPCVFASPVHRAIAQGVNRSAVVQR